MFEKEIIAIDIDSEKISILIGTKYKITQGTIIETPKGAFKDDRIINIRMLEEVIKPYLKKTKTKTKDVAFVIRGQDLITRHIVMPMVKEEAMRDSVDFELRQFIGDRIDEYYFDYEVINYNKENASGNAEVFVVASEKRKIDGYIELGKILGLNVKAIDIYANVLARVYRNLKQSFSKGIKTVGIVSLDDSSSSITITEWGKLSLENFQPYGLKNATDIEFGNIMEYEAFLRNVDMTEVKEEEDKVDRYFKSVVTQFNSIIQFYTSGKVKKNLDRIYVIGSGTKVRGSEKYLEVNLNAKAGRVPSFTDLKASVKAPKKILLKDYLYSYGLLLRRG